VLTRVHKTGHSDPTTGIAGGYSSFEGLFHSAIKQETNVLQEIAQEH